MDINFYEYLYKQLEARYSLNVYSDDNSNLIQSLYGNRITQFIKEDIMKNSGSVMSPNLKVLSLLDVNVVSFSHLIKFLDIDMLKLKANLIKIKRKNNINLISIGYGGFSINLIHFMYLLSEIVGEIKWLKKLTIYEHDNISLTNSFRIYKDMSKINCKSNSLMNKLELLDSDKLIAKRVSIRKIKFDEYNHILQKEIEEFDTKSIYFGAPDFETRKLLENSNFIFTGHSNNEVEFYHSPKVDSDITIETYGKIDLYYFFKNIIKSAEKMIDILANQNIDEIPKDTCIFRYTSEGL